MSTLTIFETVLSAASALIAAIKSVLKFAGYIGKLKPAQARST